MAISARPRGGDWLEDEIKGWKNAGVDVLASLLTKEEENALGLKDEERLSSAASIKFHSFPIADRGVPLSRESAVELIKGLENELARGKKVAIHCRQGLGRSALIAGGILVRGGVSPEEAIKRLSDARNYPVPETAEQASWIGNLAKEVVEVDLRR